MPPTSSPRPENTAQPVAARESVNAVPERMNTGPVPATPPSMIARVAAAGKEVNRANVRDAIQESKVKTLQGEVSFDQNGDITNRVVSVFQIKKDTKYPLDDVLHQYKYMGVAPQSACPLSGRKSQSNSWAWESQAIFGGRR